jgi:hypothetical protein
MRRVALQDPARNRQIHSVPGWGVPSLPIKRSGASSRRSIKAEFSMDSGNRRPRFPEPPTSRKGCPRESESASYQNPGRRPLRSNARDAPTKLAHGRSSWNRATVTSPLLRSGLFETELQYTGKVWRSPSSGRRGLRTRQTWNETGCHSRRWRLQVAPRCRQLVRETCAAFSAFSRCSLLTESS